jgi:hypothetical protein
VKEGSKPEDHPVAFFNGEGPVIIFGITVEQVLEMAAAALSGRGPMWSRHFADDPSQTSVYIVKRADRSPLLALMQSDPVNEKPNMICMIKVSNFGEGDDAVVKAFDMLRDIANRYVDNKLNKQKLYPARDEALKALGIQPRRKQPEKAEEVDAVEPVVDKKAVKAKQIVDKKAKKVDAVEPVDAGVDKKGKLIVDKKAQKVDAVGKVDAVVDKKGKKAKLIVDKKAQKADAVEKADAGVDKKGKKAKQILDKKAQKADAVEKGNAGVDKNGKTAMQCKD